MAAGTLFHPFRALGYVTADVPFAVQRRGRNTFLTVSAGKSWQLYNCAKLTLIFVGQPVRCAAAAAACARGSGRGSRAAAAAACLTVAAAPPAAAGAQHHGARFQGRLHVRRLRPARGRLPQARPGGAAAGPGSRRE